MCLILLMTITILVAIVAAVAASVVLFDNKETYIHEWCATVSPMGTLGCNQGPYIGCVQHQCKVLKYGPCSSSDDCALGLQCSKSTHRCE